jgi:hypothetical protein
MCHCRVSVVYCIEKHGRAQQRRKKIDQKTDFEIDGMKKLITMNV